MPFIFTHTDSPHPFPTTENAVLIWFRSTFHDSIFLKHTQTASISSFSLWCISLEGLTGKQTPLQAEGPLFHSSSSFPFNTFLPFSKWFWLPSSYENKPVCPYLDKGCLCSIHSRRLNIPPLQPTCSWYAPLTGTTEASILALQSLCNSGLCSGDRRWLMGETGRRGSECKWNRFQRKETRAK